MINMKFNIPNIKAMWVKVLGWNEELLKFGIHKKERDLLFVKNKNNKVNRYLKYQFKRLKNSDSNGEKFSKISLLLISKSKSFRMLALSNVRPNWYKDMKWNQVENTLKTLNGICQRPRDYYRFKRVPFPKDNGTFRYLTVPPLEMRMYMWMVNCVLHFYFEDKLNVHQYGHRKGKGLVEAWKTLADNINKYPYLLEFDLKRFHDTIDHKYLAKALSDFGLSVPLVRKITNLQSPYILEDPDPKDNGMRKPEMDLFGEIFGIESEKTLKRWNIFTGVPQGANTSAILGMICLENLKVYDLKESLYIGYADDGVILSQSKRCFEELKERLDSSWSGIQIKLEKTSWVRRSNKWIKPLKFLGCEWSEKGFFSNTRSGKRKFWEWGDLNDVAKWYETWRPIPEFRPSGWSLKSFSSSVWMRGPEDRTDGSIQSLKLSGKNYYAGLLFSKLFCGENDKKADRTLKYIKGSWLDETMRYCNIVNASSYAYIFLREVWKPEWSVKAPARYKGKFVNEVKVDRPGLIPPPVLKERTLAQLDDTNLYAPKYAQPTPLYPLSWPISDQKVKWNRDHMKNFLKEVESLNEEFKGLK